MSAILPDDVIRLWPDGAPLELTGVGSEIAFRAPVVGAGEAAMLRNVSEPSFSVFRAAKPNGVGVIICPGGGWRILAWEHEGLELAHWLAARGYTTFLLKYRVLGTPAAQADYEAEMMRVGAQIDLTRRGKNAFRALADIAPFEALGDARAIAADDGMRALAIVRERAAQWDVDPARIGMIGFSAGAFLVIDVAMAGAASLAFAAAIYGGETMGRPVPTDAPPLFTCVAQDDVPFHRIVEGLYSDWTDAGRSAELHIYRRGAHGFGMRQQGLPCDRWIEDFRVWLSDLGFA